MAGRRTGNPLQRLPQQEIYGQGLFYQRTARNCGSLRPLQTALRFIGGLFYERQTHAIIQDYEIQGFGPQIAVPGFPNTIWLTDQMRVDKDDDAAFGEASFDITKKLTVTAGIRGYEYSQPAPRLFRLQPGL